MIGGLNTLVLKTATATLLNPTASQTSQENQMIRFRPLVSHSFRCQLHQPLPANLHPRVPRQRTQTHPAEQAFLYTANL